MSGENSQETNGAIRDASNFVSSREAEIYGALLRAHRQYVANNDEKQFFVRVVDGGIELTEEFKRKYLVNGTTLFGAAMLYENPSNYMGPINIRDLKANIESHRPPRRQR